MADRFELAQQFLTSLRPPTDGNGVPRADLLDDTVTFQVGMTRVTGRDAVLQRLTGPAADRIYQQVDWSVPRVNGEAVQVDGYLPPSSPVGGIVVLIYFVGDHIALIQQQGITGAPPSPAELKLTPELKELVNNSLMSRHPILVAAVLENGQPILGYRGSTHVLSDDQLGFWARHADGNFVPVDREKPAGHPPVPRPRDADDGADSWGERAWLTTWQPGTRSMKALPEPERNADFARLGSAILVDLDRVEGSFAGAPGRTGCSWRGRPTDR